jgi:trans-aconitate 2-methyltransferase
MTHTRDWNAASYACAAAPVEAFGTKLLDRLDLQGEETVLDAGCGTGGVTAQLLARVPAGRVIGVDGSPSMIDTARERLGGRVDLYVSDLLDLELDEPVDAVFSSATFHWIADHDRLLVRLLQALKPGGRLLAQCGGEGNIASVVRAVRVVAARPLFAPHFDGWRGPWNYAGPEETVERLQRAGFVDAEAGLHRELVIPEDPREYFATIVLGSHLERLPPALRDPFVDHVLAEVGDPLELEYRRLTMSARRPE